ncbi:hypothetical protein [Fictibacillus sp. S7]|uniref:hypothetical protein n=1 Tax=Fictibacillus sp. S7 TaxID=2212476 RepID=UPI00101315A6|nr:hypothetical protein [Fictibacillus sp. S7]RXY98551.1 hypothetical protein DMO16_02085 [Fictibacillus sp. S7]
MNIKEWAPVISATAAAIASIGSWVSIYAQGKRDKRNKEAVVAPGIKNINLFLSHIVKDWEGEREFQSGFSESSISYTKVPIWNYGTTPIFNIDYYFQFENLEDYLKEIPHEDMDNSYVMTVSKDGKFHDLTVVRKFEKAKSYYHRKIVPFSQHIDSIQPNNKSDIQIPEYIIILLNNFFLSKNNRQYEHASFKLFFKYDDVNFKSWEIIFRIYIATNLTFDEKRLTASFHYEIVKKKRRIQRFTPMQIDRRLIRADKIRRTFKVINKPKLKNIFKNKKEERQL